MTEETEAIKETAIAAQEIAKTSGKVIDASSKFGGFVAKIIDGPLKQGVGIFEDKLKYYRWECQQRFMLRAQHFKKEIGLESLTRPVPLKLAIPLLQGASMEEDDDLQDIWARLLVNAANKDCRVDLKRVYIDILERITPLEVKILSEIYLDHPDDDFDKIYITYGLPDHVKSYSTNVVLGPPKTISEEIKLALENLSILGCLRTPMTVGAKESFNYVIRTVLGKSFIAACTLTERNTNK